MFGSGNSTRVGMSVLFAAFIAATTMCQFLSDTAAGQYMAWPPGDRDQGTVNCATEQCLAYVSWSSTGQYDLSANPTEAYFGQPEIQASAEKLKNAVLKLIKQKSGDSQIAQAVLDSQPDLFLKQPGTFFLSSVDIESNTLSGGATMKLGTTEGNAKTLLDMLVNSESDMEFTPLEVNGAKCYSFKDGEAPTVQIGIVDNYFLLAFGELEITDLLTNMKSPPPKWLQELDQRIGIERQSVTGYLNISQMIKLVEQAVSGEKGTNEEELKRFRAVSEILRLSEFESVQYQSGMNADGFNQVIHLNHASPAEGLLSAFSVETFGNADISAIPDESSMALAMKIEAKNIFSMAKKIMATTGENHLEKFNEAISDAKQRFGFDLEEDLVNALEGTAFVYADRSLTSPKVLAAVRVKKPANFTKFYDAMNKQLEKKLIRDGIGFEKVVKKDQTFFEVTLPNGIPICYGLVDDTLYFCNSVRGIASHLRKKDRDSGKLIQTDRFQKHIQRSKSEGFKGIVGFSEYDLSIALETGLPMAKLMLQGQLDRDVFDFTLDDLPSVEVMLKGLRPTTNVVYRTDTGLAMRTVNDLPIGFDLPTTGIMIGMMLPAVQQVRAAARRTQSLNNLRQLGLCLLNYESAKGHFPPAYSVDDQGNPLLSWRVHILPWLEENELYEQFHLDEPWDSPHNITLADQMPATFAHPGFSLKKNHTVYVTPVGADSVLSDGPINDSGAGNSFAEITDGSSNTQLLIAADEKNSVVWTAPNDLRFDDMSDDQLVDAVTGYLDMMAIALSDCSTHSFEGATVTKMGGQKLRSSFNKSDGVGFDLVP